MNILEIYEAAGISSLPADPAAAARTLGIKVAGYGAVAQSYEQTVENLYKYSRFGFSFKDERGFVIAVNENSCGERRRRFTIAHELGHCVLGHLGHGSPNKYEEREANRFAAEFLAPTAVLNCCGVNSAGEIASLCGISQSAAEIVFAELSLKRRSERGFFEFPENIALMGQFSAFIKRYREFKNNSRQVIGKSY